MEKYKVETVLILILLDVGLGVLNASALIGEYQFGLNPYSIGCRSWSMRKVKNFLPFSALS